jgi:phosphotransferase system HPr (HPr) family protein
VTEGALAVESIELEIRNPSGLHARPAATFVRAAASTGASIRVANLTRNGAEADARSILGVLGLGVSQGHRIRLTAEGEGAAEALTQLAALIEAGLGEAMPDGAGALAGRPTSGTGAPEQASCE